MRKALSKGAEEGGIDDGVLRREDEGVEDGGGDGEGDVEMKEMMERGIKIRG